MFAAGQVLEQEAAYRTFEQLPYMVFAWLGIVGSLAMLVLIIWGLIASILYLLGRGPRLFYSLTGQLAKLPANQVWKPRSFWLLLVLTGIGLLVTLILLGPEQGFPLVVGMPVPLERTTGVTVAVLALCVARLAAILALAWEFLLHLFELSPRRIWALARFSIKEAVRRKALWTFCIILVMFLFASWFIDPRQKQDQWRVYVDLVFFVMTALLLVTASVLACFSLPADIRQQTIHTVVTKPVQRFEIIIGRILGFTLLMTVVLLVMSHLSLLYVLRGIDDEAKEASMKAREAIYVRPGDLQFQELDDRGNFGGLRRTDPYSQEVIADPSRGIDVGRPWGYRQYIEGGSTQQAVWRFRKADLPAHLTQRALVPIEFAFDISRTTKGGEIATAGVSCQVMFVNTKRWNYKKHTDYLEGIDPETNKPLLDEQTRLPLRPEERARRLAEKYGYYELPQPVTVLDYKTYTIWFPAGVLEDLGDAEFPFEIRVNCRTPNQYLGMARRDLYILEDQGHYYPNFLKGTVGIWFLMVLVVSLGVVFSTYLSAVVDLLLTWMLMLCGTPRMLDYIERLGMATHPEFNPGGGPGESLIRVLQHAPPTTTLEQTTVVQIVLGGDTFFRWLFGLLVNILPNLGSFDRTESVAKGFAIPEGELFMNVLQLGGYLFLFLIVGYYLLNRREVAQ